MKASSINYGKEVIENFKLKNPLPNKAIDDIVDFLISNNQLLLVFNDKEYEVIDTTPSQQRLIEEIASNKSKVIIRLEEMGRTKATVSIFFMMDVSEFQDDTPLNILINSKVEMDLLKRNIKKDIVDFFRENFILKDMCFAILPHSENSPITLLGDRYICKLRLTGQNILEVYEISGKRADIYNDSVTLFKGNIHFIDHISDKTHLSKEIEEKFKENTRNSETLMNLWALYSEAEVELRKKEMEELGTLEYISYKYIQGDDGKDSVEFLLKKSASKSFLDAQFGYAVILNDGQKNIYIGEHAKLSSDGKTFILTNINEISDIPSSGIIGGTISGTAVSNKRRQEALERINSTKAALPSVKLILQSGETMLTRGKVYNAVDPQLVKQIFGEKEHSFTEKQRQAIDVAINTPDVALIQGPPGTGKTTIIRAIIARLNKIGDGNLKILVTSAQHDAVDNAIGKVEYGGLPANRIGGKFGSDERTQNRKMQEWIYNIQANCDVYLEEADSKRKKEGTREIAISIDEIRSNQSDYSYVREQLMGIRYRLVDLGISGGVIGEIIRVTTALDEFISINLSTEKELKLYQRKLKTSLEKQRLNVKSFLDDGRRNLLELISTINYFDEIDFNVPEYWYNLSEIDQNHDDLEKVLNIFESDLQTLELFIRNAPQKNRDNYIEMGKTIEILLNQIVSCLIQFGEQEIDAISNSLWEFRERLDSPVSVQNLIKKYASVNAATCQQAVSDRFNGLKIDPITDYDYVIIDEAARSNPLDLVIPMSIGKKIILVGDHKQLPHFLEPDVVQDLIDRKGDKSVVEILKESLFSRLFRSITEKSGSVQKTVFLNEQYRMHPQICKIVNNFYDGELISPLGNVGKEHNLGLYGDKAISWIDLQSNYGFELEDHTKSLYREKEIEVIMEELEKILLINSEFDIGIISFYGAQVRKIKERVASYSVNDQERISVGTVDSFQGKEFDIVFLSTVRCNPQGRVGFINSPNRLNVSFSRAKRLLVCVGDSRTVADDKGVIRIEQLSSLKQLCMKEGFYEQR